jgi:molybdenum cofactor synthesis domain-containing protein
MSGGDFTEVYRDIVPDEKDLISKKLIEWCDSGEIDLILTTGGTGLGPRDVTPEATRAILNIEVPGIPEAVRVETMKKTPFAVLSRGIAGVRSGTLIVNFPGSPRAVREWLEVAQPVLPHALEMVKGWRGHPVE